MYVSGLIPFLPFIPVRTNIQSIGAHVKGSQQSNISVCVHVYTTHLLGVPVEIKIRRCSLEIALLVLNTSLANIRQAAFCFDETKKHEHALIIQLQLNFGLHKINLIKKTVKEKTF